MLWELTCFIKKSKEYMIKLCISGLGHSNVGTTLNVYADVTGELKEKEFHKFGEAFKNSPEA